MIETGVAVARADMKKSRKHGGYELMKRAEFGKRHFHHRDMISAAFHRAGATGLYHYRTIPDGMNRNAKASVVSTIGTTINHESPT